MIKKRSSTVGAILKDFNKSQSKKTLKEEHGDRTTPTTINVSNESILTDIDSIAPTLNRLAKKYSCHGRANLFFTTAFTELMMLKEELTNGKKVGHYKD